MKVEEILHEGRTDFILKPMKAEFYKKWEELKKECGCDDDEKLFTQIIAQNTYILRGDSGVERGIISFHKTFEDQKYPVKTFKYWLKALSREFEFFSQYLKSKMRNGNVIVVPNAGDALGILYQDGLMIDPKFAIHVYSASLIGHSAVDQIRLNAPWVQAYKNGPYKIIWQGTVAVPALEKNLPIFDFFQRVSRAYLSEENLVYSLLAHRDDPMKFFVNFCHTLCSKCDAVEFGTEKAKESIRIDQDDIKYLEKVFSAIKEYIEEHLDEHGADRSIIEEFFIDQGLQDIPE